MTTHTVREYAKGRKGEEVLERESDCPKDSPACKQKKTLVLHKKKNCLSATGKKRQSLAVHVKRDTRLSASMKRRSLASQQKEALACTASKKRHSPASNCARASVYERESSSERERECVPERGRACSTRERGSQSV